MATPTQHSGSVHVRSVPVVAGALAACLLAASVSAQEAPEQTAATPAAATASTTASKPAPAHRKRSAFGEAMSQLTHALSDASKQAASPPPSASTGAAPSAAAVDKGTLAVESPP